MASRGAKMYSETEKKLYQCAYDWHSCSTAATAQNSSDNLSLVPQTVSCFCSDVCRSNGYYHVFFGGGGVGGLHTEIGGVAADRKETLVLYELFAC